jgi:hypothetical protein
MKGKKTLFVIIFAHICTVNDRMQHPFSLRGVRISFSLAGVPFPRVSFSPGGEQMLFLYPHRIFAVLFIQNKPVRRANHGMAGFGAVPAAHRAGAGGGAGAVG